MDYRVIHDKKKEKRTSGTGVPGPDQEVSAKEEEELDLASSLAPPFPPPPRPPTEPPMTATAPSPRNRLLARSPPNKKKKWGVRRGNGDDVGESSNAVGEERVAKRTRRSSEEEGADRDEEVGIARARRRIDASEVVGGPTETTRHALDATESGANDGGVPELDRKLPALELPSRTQQTMQDDAQQQPYPVFRWPPQGGPERERPASGSLVRMVAEEWNDRPTYHGDARPTLKPPPQASPAASTETESPLVALLRGTKPGIQQQQRATTATRTAKFDDRREMQEATQRLDYLSQLRRQQQEELQRIATLQRILSLQQQSQQRGLLGENGQQQQHLSPTAASEQMAAHQNLSLSDLILLRQLEQRQLEGQLLLLQGPQQEHQRQQQSPSVPPALSTPQRSSLFGALSSTTHPSTSSKYFQRSQYGAAASLSPLADIDDDSNDAPPTSSSPGSFTFNNRTFGPLPTVGFSPAEEFLLAQIRADERRNGRGPAASGEQAGGGELPGNAGPATNYASASANAAGYNNVKRDRWWRRRRPLPK